MGSHRINFFWFIKMEEESPKKEDLRLRKIAMSDPDAIAIYSFAFVSVFCGFQQIGVITTDGLVKYYIFVFSGLIQLLVGLLEILNEQIFKATIFMGFGSYWVIRFLSMSEKKDEASLYVETALWLSFTIVLFVNSLNTSYPLVIILFFFVLYLTIMMFSMAYTFAFEFGGYILITVGVFAFLFASLEFTNAHNGKIVIPNLPTNYNGIFCCFQG